MGGTPQRCISRGIWRTGFHSGGRLRAYALSASRLNTIDSARTLAERIDCTSRSCARCAARRRQRRVHIHLGDGRGEGDARRLGLDLVRCRAPVVH